jgi:hypothetical protein
VRIYYLDEALNGSEISFVKEALAQREGLRAIQDAEQIRVPAVLATPPVGGEFQLSTDQQIRILQRNLINAGIEEDAGTQVTFVMPKETHWGVKIQMAIMELTGFAPYVVQRWSIDDRGNIVRRSIRVINGHRMFGGKS